MDKMGQVLNRRDFINKVGIAATALTISPGYGFGNIPKAARKIHIGIIGGRFGAGFQFHEHPNCIVEAVSDLRTDRREGLMKVYKCSKSYESLEKLILDPKVEAVFIATPAPDHANHVIASLKAGKHVLCAVPAAMTLEECSEILNVVQETGLTYMMAETSTYKQGMITARKLYKEGKFGNIFSAAAEYNHPGLEELYFENGKPTWRHGLPPMHYPTHCTSFLIGLTGERLTQVSCMGWGDDSPILKNNSFKNPFWNETAFFKTDKGNPFRVEVNWKGALLETERAEWRGDKMSFYYPREGNKEFTMVKVSDKMGQDDAGFKHIQNSVESFKVPSWWATDMLPEPLRHNSGHEGSHTFITHEFIDSILSNRKPEVDIYEAIAYTAPGIVAHQSALKNGEYMKIPSFDKIIR